MNLKSEISDLSAEVARLRRERVATPLVRSFTWFRALGPERRYVVLERIGLVCGLGPCTPEAWTLARMEIQNMETEPEQPKKFETAADITTYEAAHLKRPQAIIHESAAWRDFMRAHAGKQVRITVEVLS